METVDAECKLLVGPAAIAAQVLLVSIVILGLFYKRNKEVPPRHLLVWGMDVSKQLVSSGMAHVIAMLIAILAQLKGTDRVTSECSWYFVIFSVDTTLGVSLVITMHNACVRASKRHVQKQASSYESECSASDDEELLEDMELQLTARPRRGQTRPPGKWRWVPEIIADCGSYGNPPSITRWAIQLVQFSMCVVTARMLCGLTVLTLAPALSSVAAALDRAFRGHPTALLLFVMVLCPVLMNTGQAWLQDQYLKWAAWVPAGLLGHTSGPERHSNEPRVAGVELGGQSSTSLRSGELEEAGAEHVARAVIAQRQKASTAFTAGERWARQPHA